MGSNLMIFDITGIKLDEICTPNPFLMLLMARNGLKWPFKGHLRPVKNHVDHHIFQLITAFHWKIYISTAHLANPEVGAVLGEVPDM